jgi:hypothetical protein
VFTGGFRYDNEVHRPDLALVAKDRSHWFIIEVELVSHSFEDHVLPQIRAFQYGEPESDCVGILSRELGIDSGQARTMLEYIPRSVAVVANRRLDQWQWGLSAHTVQLLTVAQFEAPGGANAIELDGSLEVVAKSLGFGTYSATDRSLRFPRIAELPIAKIQLNDPSGAPSLWTVSESLDSLWITKDVGTPDIANGAFVQIVRTVDGRLSLRAPR